MKQEFTTFKTDIDAWVKEFQSDLTRVKNLHPIVEAHSDNIDHNYELLQEMRAEINKLKEELSAMRMVQLLHLKSELKHKA